MTSGNTFYETINFAEGILMRIYRMSFDVLILNIVLILSKKSFLKDLNCYIL